MNFLGILILVAVAFVVYEGFKNGWNWQKMVAGVAALAAAAWVWLSSLLHLPGAGP